MHRRALTTIAIALALVGMPAMSHAEPVLLHAAGSLRDALDDVAAAYEVERHQGDGDLRRVRNAARADRARHPRRCLANRWSIHSRSRGGTAADRWRCSRATGFARWPSRVFSVTPANILDHGLEPSLKLGTSTPQADPSGDYAFEVFRKADAIHQGAYTSLSRKALQAHRLADQARRRRSGRNLYGMLIAQGRADLFLTYCTNAKAAQRQNPDQQIVALPDQLRGRRRLLASP